MRASSGFARLPLAIAFLAAATFGAGAAPSFVPIDEASPGWLPELGSWQSPNPSSPMSEGVELDPAVPSEAEPNGNTSEANALVLAPDGATRLQGRITSSTDVDFFSFAAQPGDRLYATLVTSASLDSSDSLLTVLAADGSTVIEQDNDNGSLGASSSVVAGTPLVAGGTYFLQVGTPGALPVRPYVLYVQLRRDAPVAEAEPNDASPQVVPNGASVQGTLSSNLDVDLYSVSLAEGETFVMMVDADPERDAVDTTLRIAMGPFAGELLTLDDPGGAGPDAEALAFTAVAAGTFTFGVLGGPSAGSGTYLASTTIVPAAARMGSCFTATQSTPFTIAAGGSDVTSALAVPFALRVEDVDVQIAGTHANLPDLDVSLIAPGGARTPLWDDLGSAMFPSLSLVLDDEAATPPLGALLAGQRVQPEAQYRLATFDDVDSQGTWGLRVSDDTANAAGGQITSWSLRICGRVPVSCPPGRTLTQAYATNFEADDGAFTHGGVADAWARGTPGPVAPFNDCASGTQCFKTNLAGSYASNSDQDLLSPFISLTGLEPPIVVRWSHRYQMESATFDHYSVDATPMGGTARRLWEWSDYTSVTTHGTAGTTIASNAGWAAKTARADALAGQTVQLKFHLDSNASSNFEGVAIDDVSVIGCRADPIADLAITIDDGTTSVAATGSTTYTIVATDTTLAGANATGSVSVDFDPRLACTWTCSGAGGTCAPAGAGDIADAATFVPTGSVTYIATCVLSGSATGNLVSTASVLVGGGLIDPDSNDNNDADLDTIVAAPDNLFSDGFE